MSDRNDTDHDEPMLEEMLKVVANRKMDADRRDRLKSRILEQIEETEDLWIVRRNEGEWHKLTDGIRIKLLRRDPQTGAETSLWRVDPGARVDGHAHEMDEECLVLEGDLQIGGELLVAGDYLLGKQGVDHPAVSSPSGALLLLRSQPYLPR